MTEIETKKLVAIMTAAFPTHFAKYDIPMIERLVDVWKGVLEDYSYEDAHTGLMLFMKTDLSGFPPTPAMIIDKIAKHTEHRFEYEITGTEAWALVSKALKNSNYNSEEEFSKLPPLVQKAVGSPSNLREWASMDSNTVHSVQMSNFLRMYDGVCKRAKDDAKLPPDFRMQIETRPTMMIETSDPQPKAEQPEWVDDRLKELREELKGGN